MQTYDIQSTESKEYLLRSADILLQNSEPILARNLYSCLLKQDSKDAHAVRGLGQCFFELNEMLVARKCFEKAFELTQEEKWHLWLGLCYFSEGEEEKALSEYKKIIHLQLLTLEEQFLYYKGLGNVYTKMLDYEKAENAYSKALEIKPNSFQVYINLGTLELQRKKYDVSVLHFQKALLLNPDNAKAYCGLGLVCQENKKYLEAEKYYVKALDIDYQYWVAICQLAQISEKLKRYSSIEEKLLVLIEKQPNLNPVVALVPLYPSM
jgi:tetratricopeptide (TPR) repeat protein